MDTNLHNLTNLFAQLGLANSKTEIDKFIASHQISNSVHISQASFWSSAQASFLTESLDQDGDWSEIIDQFDTLLRA
ncbi:DUF2789 domain-containing protein [Pseudoalteromonas denitrificans]|jgi:hypothetical protein|uniref:DUF2789 domain-containing protein n=1 Tax=Pseudoalteromonas denitrificans DSM 6059 TaxID=1123010 RepID=A0A1I1MHJ3_9GAMM|nr:DUF2789 domain-containing protein [Pseudoalteromonas denitrificans]SFC84911.1 Protein of unknown function [Pseudoalteromonas denitrificans DSM 6059]